MQQGNIFGTSGTPVLVLRSQPLPSLALGGAGYVRLFLFLCLCFSLVHYTSQSCDTAV